MIIILRLKPVSDHPYLGVHLSSNLSWNKHIDIITTKATSQLNFLRRNLSKCSTDVKSMAYTTMVRPQLEYASAAWHPYTKNYTSSNQRLGKCVRGISILLRTD